MPKNINRLRVLRAELKLSQLDAALLLSRKTKTKITNNRWWFIENGYKEPTPEERAALAAFFGVTEAEVFPATDSKVAS